MLLRTVVQVLVGTLRETNVIDNHLLDARMQEALAAVAAPPATGKYVCTRCQQQVKASATVMTADGPVCDSCSAK